MSPACCAEFQGLLTWPHSVHSLSARSSLNSSCGVNCTTSYDAFSRISVSAHSALATTMGLESPSRSCRQHHSRVRQSVLTALTVSMVVFSCQCAHLHGSVHGVEIANQVVQESPVVKQSEHILNVVDDCLMSACTAH